jgi:hypothetical protein
MEQAADNEQGRTQQPTIDGSGKGKQWLATMRVRGKQLAMAAKGGGGWRRDCHGQRGVIAASEAAEVPRFFFLFYNILNIEPWFLDYSWYYI